MKINPFANANPMSWQDAAKVAGILTAASFFVTFLVPYSYQGIREGLTAFCFEALRFFGATFFSNFIALAGLAQLTQQKEKQK